MNQHFLLLLSIFLISTITQAATTMVFPQLPEADTLDTEVSTNRILTITRNQLEVVLELDATDTNNVEVAFGVDANEDGSLDIEEETLISLHYLAIFN